MCLASMPRIEIRGYNMIRAYGSYAVISVNDIGSGILQKVLDKIFQPFFTPNQPGREQGWGYR